MEVVDEVGDVLMEGRFGCCGTTDRCSLFSPVHPSSTCLRPASLAFLAPLRPCVLASLRSCVAASVRMRPCISHWHVCPSVSIYPAFISFCPPPKVSLEHICSAMSAHCQYLLVSNSKVSFQRENNSRRRTWMMRGQD